MGRPDRLSLFQFNVVTSDEGDNEDINGDEDARISSNLSSNKQKERIKESRSMTAVNPSNVNYKRCLGTKSKPEPFSGNTSFISEP